MPRRTRALIRHGQDKLDPKFGRNNVNALINKVMLNGKKHVAMRLVYSAIDKAAAKLKKDQIEVFDQVMDNIMPMVEVRAKRIGGANYQVPTEIPAHRRNALALRWLVDSARARKGQSMEEKLAVEMVDAYNNTGTVVKKKEETHRMAEANRALAHYSKF
jgi:small subunit ribosomal protein S7